MSVAPDRVTLASAFEDFVALSPASQRHVSELMACLRQAEARQQVFAAVSGPSAFPSEATVRVRTGARVSHHLTVVRGSASGRTP